MPHGRLEASLYEVQIPEKKYVRGEKSWANFVCDPLVEGVYESQVISVNLMNESYDSHDFIYFEISVILVVSLNLVRFSEKNSHDIFIYFFNLFHLK